MTDHYQTLGVARNATPDDIKKAYRRLAGIHHPDKGGDTAQFQKIQQAYETLSDTQKKQEYDNPNPFGPGGMHHGFSHGFPGGFHFQMNGFDMGDIFGQMFGQQRGFKQQPSYRTTVWITLEQAYNGGEQVMQMQGPSGTQTIKVEIPRGVENGSNLRYENIIPNSILLVEFRIHPHSKYERDGSTLYSVHDIDVLDLIVGTTFKFTTISGKTLDVKVPEKTQPGNKLRLQGEGMPLNNGYGDQMILLKPMISDTIDTRIIDSIKQYK